MAWLIWTERTVGGQHQTASLPLDLQSDKPELRKALAEALERIWEEVSRQHKEEAAVFVELNLQVVGEPISGSYSRSLVVAQCPVTNALPQRIRRFGGFLPPRTADAIPRTPPASQGLSSSLFPADDSK